MERKYVFQDPRQVATKFSKPIETFCFPVGDDVIVIVRDWVKFLIEEKLFGSEDRLFPKTLNGQDENKNFVAVGLTRDHRTDVAPVRRIFKAAYGRVGLPYFPPHTVRNTLTQLAYKLKLDPEQMKAWSQNMGHDKSLTTLNSYGHVSVERQGELIGALGKNKESMAEEVTAMQIAEIYAIVKGSKV